MALILIAGTQLESFRLLGSFQPWDLISDGLRWASKNTDQAGGYVKSMHAERTVSLIVLLLVFALLPNRLFERYVANTVRRCRRIGLVLIGGLVSLSAFAWMPWLPTTSYHSFLLASATKFLFGRGMPAEERPLLALNQGQLAERYRAVTGAKKIAADAYFGTEKGFDVLFFVMETMPASCVSFDGPLDGFPNIASLKPLSFVASAQHSTYPVTIRALFSMLTGMYPPDSSRDSYTLKQNTHVGMMHTLDENGYQTAVYGSGDSIIPRAYESFKQLGFERVVSHESDPAYHTDAWIRRQLRLDKDSLEDLKKDVSGWIDRDQRYAAVYLPQISHGPWIDLGGDGKEKDLMKRGRKLAVQLDQWLGAILGLLEQKGRLQRTVIVVTGDHGLRTFVEAPQMTNLMDDNAFHVPFLLYAPGSVKHTERIPYLTSHIDIAPSILDLLGISKGREMEQGSPIWDTQIASRKTYFWANLYQGNDGVFDGGQFYGWNRTADLVYGSPHMHFSPHELQARNTPGYKRATEDILNMDAIRMAWFRSGDKR